jgi:hypothetical protein
VERCRFARIELKPLRLRHADAVDIGNDIVSDDTDLALLADFSRDCAEHGMPARGPESCADDLGRQRDQLVANHVALRAQGFLEKPALLEIPDETMRGGQRESERIGDFRDRDSSDLTRNMANDGECPVEWSIGIALLHLPVLD